MLATLPWELAPDLPWQVFTSPADKWAVQPSFVVGELVFIALAVLAFVHARRHGRANLLIWVGALVAGTANDVIFMALPLVDNFWQAQGMIMLTPRLPLYIPCVYVCFMYLPTASVMRLGVRPLPSAALAGLAAILFYAPYDILGAKFLWWTWHDTDLPIANRLLGVPIGSTMWVITFTATFAWLVRKMIDRDPELPPRAFALGLAAVAGLSTLLMMVQMAIVQRLDGGYPGVRGLIGVVVVYGALAAWGLREATPRTRTPSDRVLNIAIAAYFVVMAATLASFDPASHRSASLHQTYGPCHVEATDLTGALRYEFLCAADYDEDFSFDCVDGPPAEGTEWYTVCGRPHTDFPRWMTAVAGLGALGTLMYSFLLGAFRRT